MTKLQKFTKEVNACSFEHSSFFMFGKKIELTHRSGRITTHSATISQEDIKEAFKLNFLKQNEISDI